MRLGAKMSPKWDQKGGQEASKTMSKSYKKQDAFSEGQLGTKVRESGGRVVGGKA